MNDDKYAKCIRAQGSIFWIVNVLSSCPFLDLQENMVLSLGINQEVVETEKFLLDTIAYQQNHITKAAI